MWQALVHFAARWVERFQRGRGVLRESPQGKPIPSAAPVPRLEPLERMVLTDEVARTLFGGFAQHRRGDDGEQEIGWVLLGLREATQAVVMATLPAGTQRDAGVAHIRFNSDAQGIASRIVRQWDKRLVILGVAHTHPGSLRHPSDGDYHGDSQWVGQLRGREGVFAIGTADVAGEQQQPIASYPEPHRQVLGDACFSWYALRQGERRYRRLPVALTLGPDLARPLHELWDILETHADSLDRLCRQQSAVNFEVVHAAPGEASSGPALALTLPLAEPKTSLRVLLEKDEIRYFYQQGRDVSAVDPDETRLDRAVYLILAELAHPARKPRSVSGNF